MKTLTPKQLADFELVHCHAGNGYAMCEILDKDYCRVTPLHGTKNRAFLAAIDRLTVAQRSKLDLNKRPVQDKNGNVVMEDSKLEGTEQFAELQELRHKLAHGLVKSVGTHIVSA